jgi:hypothetical protein
MKFLEAAEAARVHLAELRNRHYKSLNAAFMSNRGSLPTPLFKIMGRLSGAASTLRHDSVELVERFLLKLWPFRVMMKF